MPRLPRPNAPPEQWRYCPTSENLADTASRGVKANALKEILYFPYEGHNSYFTCVAICRKI